MYNGINGGDFNSFVLGWAKVVNVNLLSNSPYSQSAGNHYGMCQTVKNGDYKTQLYFDYADKVIYLRTLLEGTWSSWVVFTNNIPSFYKNYSTLANLAVGVESVVTSIFNNQDLNDFTSVGAYICGSGTMAQTISNCPCDTAFRLDVLMFSSAVIFQRIMSTNSNLVYIRTLINGSWGSWYSYSGTIVQ